MVMAVASWTVCLEKRDVRAVGDEPSPERLGSDDLAGALLVLSTYSTH